MYADQCKREIGHLLLCFDPTNSDAATQRVNELIHNHGCHKHASALRYTEYDHCFEATELVPLMWFKLHRAYTQTIAAQRDAAFHLNRFPTCLFHCVEYGAATLVTGLMQRWKLRHVRL